jgi:hypothetical protein
VCCGPYNEAEGLLAAAAYRELRALIHDWHPRAQADVLTRLRAGGKRNARH